MPYIIAIPSYNRTEILTNKTLKFLKDYKINRELIYIFVANNIEFNNYTSAIPKDLYDKIIVGKKGIANQRKFISHYFPNGQHILSIDDDVEGLYKLVAGSSSKLTKVNNLDGFIKSAFEQTIKHGLFIWGIYPTKNPLFMFDDTTYDMRFIIGVFYGYINRKEAKLNPTSNNTKEDVERSILFFKKDRGMVRFNNYAVKTKFLADDGGGIGSINKRITQNNKDAKMLEKRYPDIVKVYYRKNGFAELRIIRNATNTIKRNSTKKRKNSLKNKTIKLLKN